MTEIPLSLCGENPPLSPFFKGGKDVSTYARGERKTSPFNKGRLREIFEEE